MKSNEELLIERAYKLARLKISNDIIEDTLSVVEFGLNPERYAIEEKLIREVILLKDLTPIPGVPDFVAGVTVVRGKIISVINLKVILGIKTKGITDLNRIIILKYDQMEFGILTDSISGTLRLKNNAISDVPANIYGDAGKFIKGISEDGLIILNGLNLITSKLLLVDQKHKN